MRDRRRTAAYCFFCRRISRVCSAVSFACCLSQFCSDGVSICWGQGNQSIQPANFSPWNRFSLYIFSRAILEDLNAAFQDLHGSIGPQVGLVYKEVSYESLSDPQFRARFEDVLRRKGKQALVDEPFSEFDAAREKAVPSQRPDQTRQGA
jgi:hypothetical protein